MIYYYADDEESLTPQDEWYAFNYFIPLGKFNRKVGDEGIIISANSGIWKKTHFDVGENLRPVTSKMPSKVMHYFIQVLFGDANG